MLRTYYSTHIVYVQGMLFTSKCLQPESAIPNQGIIIITVELECLGTTRGVILFK